MSDLSTSSLRVTGEVKKKFLRISQLNYNNFSRNSNLLYDDDGNDKVLDDDKKHNSSVDENEDDDDDDDYRDFSTYLEEEDADIDVFKKRAEVKDGSSSFTDQLSIEIMHLNENEIKVKMHNVTRTIANSLRRMCIEEIPCMAFENLELMWLSSSMDDEKLAHRLGQIPFTSQEAHKFNFEDECDCNSGTSGCPKCAVVYSLHVKNVDERKVRIVTTLDLRPKDDSTLVRPTGGHFTKPKLSQLPIEAQRAYANLTPSQLAAILAIDKNEVKPSIEICRLLPGQEVEFEATVRKGTVRRNRHHKFQPSNLIGFKCPGIVRLDQEKLAKLSVLQKRNLVNTANDGILAYDEITGMLSLTEEFGDSIKCKQNKLVEELVAQYGQQDAIRISEKESYFMLTITTNGSLRPEEIFFLALQNFTNSFDRILRNLSLAL